MQVIHVKAQNVLRGIVNAPRALVDLKIVRNETGSVSCRGSNTNATPPKVKA
jgi:hypothetical protein